jgi:hypothetical protein
VVPRGIRIQLEKNPAEFVPGELIVGVVELELDEPSECKSIELAWGWRTFGDCEGESDAVGKLQLGQGQLASGRHRFDFDFVCPNLYPSYAGSLFTLAWWIEARADLPWSIDPRANLSFSIACPRGTQAQVGRLATSRAWAVVRNVFGVALIVPALLLANVAVRNFVADRWDIVDTGLLFVPVAALLFLAWVALAPAIGRLGVRKLDTKVLVSRDTLAIEVELASRHLLGHVRASLIAEEYASKQDDQRRRIQVQRTHEEHRVEHVGRAGEHRLRIELPRPDFALAGWSINMNYAKLRWHVELGLEFEGWLEVVEIVPLHIERLS